MICRREGGGTEQILPPEEEEGAQEAPLPHGEEEEEAASGTAGTGDQDFLPVLQYFLLPATLGGQDQRSGGSPLPCIGSSKTFLLPGPPAV